MRIIFKKWFRNDDAAVAVEMGMIMPLMVTMLLGVMDVGVGVVTSQKVINSVQTVADLLGREESISTATLNNAIEAGKLSLLPYSTTSYGIDVAGIKFNGGPTIPVVIWRDTINMSPNADILIKASGLGNDQDGVLGVTVKYTYTPYFSKFLAGSYTMYEVSYVRGRKGFFIPRV